MKSKLFFGLLLLASCAPKHEDVKIEGRLENIDDGLVVELFKREGDVGRPFMSDTLVDGGFQFAYTPEDGTLDRLMVVCRTDNMSPMGLELWVRKGSDITISGDNPYIYSWDVDGDTDEQKLRQKLISASCAEWEEYQRINIERNKYYRAYAMERSEETKNVIDSLSKVADGITLDIYKRNAELLLDSKVNEVWFDELGRMARTLKYNKEFPIKEELQKLYDALDAGQKDTDAGKTAYLALNPPVVAGIGDKAPDGDIYDLQGNIHHISDFKGRYVLLDFWSDGCGPCIMAQPELKELSDMYKGRLEVVSLNIQDKKGWEKVSEKHKMTWHNWNDLKGDNGLSAVYGVRGIPHFVMVSPEGEIMDSWAGYGKGHLKLKVKNMLEAKSHTMSIRTENGNKVVDYPKTETSQYDVISITQVKLTDKATVIKVKATYIPKYWIMLDKNTSLTSDTGVKCALRKAEGFKIGEKVFMPESGVMDFTLYFDPLPKETKSFDLSEGEGVEGGYKVKGIALY